MGISPYKPLYPPIKCFINRFFIDTNLLFEQETKVALPTLDVGDDIVIFDNEYSVEKRLFAFNEDAFMTVYYLIPRTPIGSDLTSQ